MGFKGPSTILGWGLGQNCPHKKNGSTNKQLVGWVPKLCDLR